MSAVDDYRRQLLATSHEVLEETAAKITEIAERNDWNPAPGSPADDEVKAEEKGPGGVWGEEPMLTALSFAALSTFAMCDQLNTMASLVDEEAVATMFGLQVISRSAIEAASLAWWMLEPNIGPRARVGRSFRIRERTVRDSLRVLGEVGAPADAVDESEKRLQEVLGQAVARGIRVDRRKENREPVNIAVRMPGKAELVAAVLDDSNFTIGKGLYSFLAGISHADPWALHQFFTFEKDPVKPHVAIGEPSLNFGMLHNVVFLSVMPALSVGDRLVRLYGWELGEWGDFALEAKAALIAVDPRDRIAPTP